MELNLIVFLVVDEDEDVMGAFIDKKQAMNYAAEYNDGDGYVGLKRVQEWDIDCDYFIDEMHEPEDIPIEGKQIQRIGKGSNAKWYSFTTIKHASELNKIYEIDAEEESSYSIFVREIDFDTKQEVEKLFDEYEKEIQNKKAEKVIDYKRRKSNAKVST